GFRDYLEELKPFRVVVAWKLGERLLDASHRLAPRPERRCAAGMPASPPEDACTTRFCAACDLVAEVRLARSRAADDDEQASAPGDRVLQSRLEDRQLVVTPQHRRG